jgi:hypothetical protein
VSQHPIHILANAIAGFPSLKASREELVVARFGMADVRGHRKRHRFLVEALRSGRPSDPPAIFLARVNRDSVSAIARAARVQLANAIGEALDEIGVDLATALCLALPTPGSRIGILQALSLGLLERLFLDEYALTLITLSRPAPFQHDGSKRRVLGGATRECRVPRWEKDEMIEIRTRETERTTISCQENPCLGPQVFAAFVTVRLARRDEDAQLRFASTTAAHAASLVDRFRV